MIYDLIILGGGPAGVAAGIYASRKKIDTLLITGAFGGQFIFANKIENFIGIKEIPGFKLATALEEHLKSQQNGIEILEGMTVVDIRKKDDFFEVKDSKEEVHQAKNILLALGNNYRKLNIPGEKEFEGKGVFYCSVCDAPLMKNKPVAVIGGGNSGLEAVRDLLPYASEIFLLEREEFLKGDPISLHEIEKESKVKIITQVAAQEAIGNEFVAGLKYKDLKTGEEKVLNVSGIFVEIGYQPNTQLVKDLVELNNMGEIVVDHKTMQTSQKGIWAAGDITDGLYNQINTAIGDGVKAVLNVYDNLSGRQFFEKY